MSYSSEVIADSPLVYLKLDEASGGAVNDGDAVTISQGYYQGSPTMQQSSAHPGSTYAITLNGSSQYAYVTLDGYSGDYTVEGWYRFTGFGTYTGLFGTWTNNTAGNYGVGVDCNGSGQVDVNIPLNTYNGWSLNQGGVYTFSTGTWYHVVLTVKSSTKSIKFYVNGTVQGSYTAGGSSVGFIDTGGKQLKFGKDYTNYTYGKIDEVAFYKSELSAARILAHYTAASGASVAAVKTNTAIGGNKIPIVSAIKNKSITATYSNLNLDAQDATVFAGSVYDALILQPKTNIGVNGSIATVTAFRSVSVAATVSNTVITNSNSGVVGGSDNAIILATKSSITVDGIDTFTATYEGIIGAALPIHYYKFDGNLSDSGSIPSALSGGSVAYGTGIAGSVGNSSINSASGAMNYPLHSGYYNWTYEFWIKTDTTSNVVLFARDEDDYTYASAPGLPKNRTPKTSGIGLSDGKLATFSASTFELGVSTSSLVFSKTSYVVNNNVWHHIAFGAVTSGGTTTYFSYLDGVAITGYTFQPNPTVPRYGLFGVSGDSYVPMVQYIGSFDDFAIYDRAMDGAEIASHFSAGYGVVQNINMFTTTTNTQVAGQSIGSGPTIAADVSNISIRPIMPTIITPGQVSIGANLSNIVINGKNAGLSSDLNVNQITIANNTRVKGYEARVSTVADSFILIPVSDTSLTAVDSAELISIDFGALLYNQEKIQAFKVGNYGSAVVGVTVSIIGANGDILELASLSLDKVNYSSSIIIDTIQSNEVTDPIWLKFSPAASSTGPGTFLINVEQANA